MRSWLIKNGIPFDVAWTMDEADALAYCVAFGQFEGNEFDWSTKSWKRKE